MKISMQEANASTVLSTRTWDLAVVGAVLDERGKQATNFAASRSSRVVTANYDADLFEISIDGGQFKAEETIDFFRRENVKRVVLESTTLGFVEVFLCSRALRNLGVQFLSILYVEPGEYSTVRGERLLHRRDFELSEEVRGFKGIPSATLITTERTRQRFAFFLGFEERRLDVAVQTQRIRPEDAVVIFGVPAFSPGWEMHSFANNIRVIRDNSLSGGVHFCGAENPLAAYETLASIYDALLPGERLIIGPLGTKPNGIGAALFAASHSEVGLLYDHPRKLPGRTSSVARWHLYDITI